MPSSETELAVINNNDDEVNNSGGEEEEISFAMIQESFLFKHVSNTLIGVTYGVQASQYIIFDKTEKSC